MSTVLQSHDLFLIVSILTVATRAQERLALVHLIKIQLKLKRVLDVVRVRAKCLLCLLSLPPVAKQQSEGEIL